MSFLGGAAQDYLAVRRALGYKLQRAGRLLPDLVAHVEDAGAEVLTAELALAWARQPTDVNPNWWSERLGVARGFARYLHTLDPRTEVLPGSLWPQSGRRATPYLYSAADVQALIEAARELPVPLCAANYSTLIGLLAATGMRVGEVIGLDLSDIDWEHQLLRVRGAKFNKARQVPLHHTTVQALSVYTQARDRHARRPGNPSFLVSAAGTRLIYNVVHRQFFKLVDQVGLRHPVPGRRPRLHDLRHTFAVRTLEGWYADGGDVQARLPLLSTYLGHVNPANTYWYLSAAPQLLASAVGRLEGAWELLS